MLPDDDPNLEFSFNSINVTQEDVKDHIHLLNVSKPGGSDEVMPRIIKIACNPLIEHLTQLLTDPLHWVRSPLSGKWRISQLSSKAKATIKIP